MTWGFHKQDIEEAIADSLVASDDNEVFEHLQTAYNAGCQSAEDYQEFQQAQKQAEKMDPWTQKPPTIRRGR